MAWYPFDHLGNEYHGITLGITEERPFSPLDYNKFEGDVAARWQPVRAVVSKDKKRKRGDFPCFSDFPPILGARALEALRPLLTQCDILPLDCATEPLVAINPPILSGALDCEKSEVNWFEPGKRALLIHRYVFLGEEVRRAPIFRLAEDRSVVLLSEAFHEAVESHGLKGLRFFPLEATWGS